MSEIFPEKPITSLPEAVAFMGALPMKVGPHLSELERMRLRVDEVERAYTFDTAALKRRIAELEAERHSTNEALDDAVQELRGRPSCLCPSADQPGPHQFGCPLAEVPRLSERPVNELTTVYMPVAAYREDPHDSPLHHDYKGPGRDFPELGGAS